MIFDSSKFKNMQEIVAVIPEYLERYFLSDMSKPFFGDLTDTRDWTRRRKDVESIIPAALLDIYNRRNLLADSTDSYKEAVFKIEQIVVDKLLII